MSTVEMQVALVRETCDLQALPNVSLPDPHAIIAGTLGNYSVHVSSAAVHRQLGGTVCSVPDPRPASRAYLLAFRRQRY